MSSPKRFVDAIHIGTGEFSFCLGATTVAGTRPPNGFRDVGNVDVYQLQIENETFQREGAYRGKKSVDAKFSIKQSLSYLFRMDELTKDNLTVVLMGEDAATNNARGALTNALVTLPFTAGTPSSSKLWYDLVSAGALATHLISALVFGGTPQAATTAAAGDTFTDNAHGLANGDRVILTQITTTTGISTNTPYFVVGATTNTFQLALTAGGAAIDLTGDGSVEYLAAAVEDTSFELDTEAGRIRLLTVYDEDLFVFVTGPEITSASAEYMEFITPLQNASFEGFGRFMAFHAADEALTWDHRDFSCTITPQNFAESTGKSPGMFDFLVTITGTRGRVGTAKRAIND